MKKIQSSFRSKTKQQHLKNRPLETSSKNSEFNLNLCFKNCFKIKTSQHLLSEIEEAKKKIAKHCFSCERHLLNDISGSVSSSSLQRFWEINNKKTKAQIIIKLMNRIESSHRNHKLTTYHKC